MTVKEWINQEQGKHFCHCGCKEEIKITRHHHKPSEGIPLFKPGHLNKLNPPNLGKKFSEEHRRNISKNHADVSNKNNPNYGKLGKNSPNWKGGSKLSRAKINAKRKQFGFNPLNNWFKDSEAHHLNLNDIIFIPKELHKSIGHSVTQNRKMKEINDAAYKWLCIQEML